MTVTPRPATRPAETTQRYERPLTQDPLTQRRLPQCAHSHSPRDQRSSQGATLPPTVHAVPSSGWGSMSPPHLSGSCANLPPRPAHAHDSDARAPLWGAHGTANQGTGEAAAIMGARTRGSLEPAPGRARDPHRIACPTPPGGDVYSAKRWVARLVARFGRGRLEREGALFVCLFCVAGFVDFSLFFSVC